MLKLLSHPNITGHHIIWLKVYFKPTGEKITNEIANLEFFLYGYSTERYNSRIYYNLPNVSISFRTEKSGAIIAYCYCLKCFLASSMNAVFTFSPVLAEVSYHNALILEDSLLISASETSLSSTKSFLLPSTATGT